MAKTLVALYDTVTDAEQVVQELIADGFSRSAIHLALDHTKSRTAPAASVERDAAYEPMVLVFYKPQHVYRACRRIPLEVIRASIPSCWLCILSLFGFRSSLFCRSLTGSAPLHPA
jgi:hypothetical protein